MMTDTKMSPIGPNMSDNDKSIQSRWSTPAQIPPPHEFAQLPKKATFEQQSMRPHKLSQHIKHLEHGEGTIHGYRNSNPDSQIPGVRGSSANSGANENPAALADDATYHIKFGDAAFATIQDVGGNPKLLEEAKSRTDWPKWQEAINIESKTLKNAGMWHEVV